MKLFAEAKSNRFFLLFHSSKFRILYAINFDDGSIPSFDGSIPNFDGTVPPQFDGSVPEFDSNTTEQ